MNTGCFRQSVFLFAWWKKHHFLDIRPSGISTVCNVRPECCRFRKPVKVYAAYRKIFRLSAKFCLRQQESHLFTQSELRSGLLGILLLSNKNKESENETMNKSKVYFTDMRARPGTNLLEKLRKLMVAAGAQSIDFNEKFTPNQRIIAGNAQFAGIAAGRGVRFTTGLLLLGKGLGMRETPIRPHSWH